MTDPSRRHGASAPEPLGELLSFLRPAPADTVLLRACLLEGEAGREALALWSRSGPAAELLRPADNRLFPLLADAARRAEVRLDPLVRSRLRAALASEEVRYAAYCQLLGPALAALREDGAEVVVLKGAALAETVYPRPELRHSHDIDVLIAPRQRASVVACLERLGWRRVDGERASGTDTLLHPFGLPFRVHTRWIRGSIAPTDFEVLRARARPIELAGVAVLTPSSADTLLHILGQAVTSGSFRSLLWACDAFFCIGRCRDLDWEHVARELAASRLGAAYGELLDYLRGGLDVALPATITEVLESNRDGAPDRELLIASLDAGAFGRRRMWTASSRRARVLLLKWLLWPRADVARAIAPGASPWRLPIDNLRRAGGGWFSRLLRRRPRGKS